MALSRSYFEDNLRELRGRLDRLRRHLHLVQALPALDDATPLSGQDAHLIVDGNVSLPDYVPLVVMPLPQIPRSVLPEQYPGWTVGLVRQAIDFMAARSAHTVDSFLPVMAEDARTRIQELEAEIREGEAASAARERQDEERQRQYEEDFRHTRLLPSADTLDRVVRYEAHLNRQLASALQQLRTWQSRRSQAPLSEDDPNPPPSPAAT